MKILRGRLITAQNWAFLTRFCFLTEHGMFKYNFIIGGSQNEESMLNLLLYYDAPNQWPSVYPSNKSCEEKQSILKADYGQIVPLSANVETSSISGCSKTNDSWSKAQCTSYRLFKSARPRWWFIALADCSSQNGLNVTFDLSLTNGSPGSFWREHFSADEFYILPILIAAGSIYIILLCLSIYIAVQLRQRRLLHVTYRLYIASIVFQLAGLCCEIYSYSHQGITGFDAHQALLMGRLYESGAETDFTLLLLLLALGYTVTKSSLTRKETQYLFSLVGILIVLQLTLFIYQSAIFDPGLVLYIYESPPGLALLALRIFVWGIFVLCCWRTSRKSTTKFRFYASLLVLGSVWFLCHPLTVLVITFIVDKWIRESVVKGCSVWIMFLGHVVFFLITRPASSNERFPFHIRTFQVGPVYVGGNHNYEPRRGATATTVFTVPCRNMNENIHQNENLTIYSVGHH
ncbi:transmembrane protein 145-like [Fopius arisanus]|uniref:Transmembrane protein 145-like n=1 Tax=Fopius arisanus TaxID=64838 RepID=A0A9R1TKF2_9HYME|nr:PREDICTED: transmembrane protein 145-like [Fopius arisanus]